MDKDEKGKQAGWSNPNYEVTEGKLTRKVFSSLFARLCVVYLFFQSSSRLLVKGVLYTIVYNYYWKTPFIVPKDILEENRWLLTNILH